MINIDRQSRIPIYEQIITEFQNLIVMSILKSGDQIPSVRNLSVELSLNPNTIQRAYNELEKKGITTSTAGIGRFVSPNAKIIISDEKQNGLDDFKSNVKVLAIAGIEKAVLQTILDETYQNIIKGDATND